MSKLSRKSLRVYLLSAAPTLFFLTGIFIPKGSVILLALIVIIIFISTKRSKWIELFLPNNTWYTIALFIVFSATSTFWSLTPVNTLYKVLPLTAMLLLALIAVNFAMAFVDDEIEALRKGIIIGGFSGFLLLGVELSSNAYITRLLRPSLWELISVDELYHMTKILNGGVAIASLFFWPWFFVVWTAFKYYISIPILVGSALVILFGANDAPFFALTLGILASTIVGIRPNLGRHVLTVFVLISIFVAPLAPKYLFSLADSREGAFVTPSTFVTFDRRIISIPNAWYHRLTIWKVTGEKIEQKPILGHGYDTSRALYKKNDKIRYQRYNKSGDLIVAFKSEPIPLHPHNVVLQIWLELGLVGAIFLAILLFLLIRLIFCEGRQKLSQFAGAGILITTLSINMVSYGAWQSWWLGAQIITIFIFSCLISNQTQKISN